MKSATHKAFGRSAVNCRSTRSAGLAAAGSARVVRGLAPPRSAPVSPAARIRRSTVHRATVIPSRFNTRHTLRAPYTS